MKVGIVGLGLIGGSIAKAIKNKTKHAIFAWDSDKEVCQQAKAHGVIDEIMDNGNPQECDFTIIALYPIATIEYVKTMKKLFKKNSIVVDCAGVKKEICDILEPIAKEEKFFFCGGHPMAGIEKSGFAHSMTNLFDGATMILTPPKENYLGSGDKELKEIELLFSSIGFKRIQVATPQEHDEMIAYTSQLAHVVSSAYIKSDLVTKFKGFSAGSFKDMTRVAKLNEHMWAELFLENSEFLGKEVDIFIQRLQEYSKAIKEKDEETLKTLLKEGKEIRMAVD